MPPKKQSLTTQKNKQIQVVNVKIVQHHIKPKPKPRRKKTYNPPQPLQQPNVIFRNLPETTYPPDFFHNDALSRAIRSKDLQISRLERLATEKESLFIGNKTPPIKVGELVAETVGKVLDEELFPIIELDSKPERMDFLGTMVDGGGKTRTERQEITRKSNLTRARKRREKIEMGEMSNQDLNVN